MIRSKLYCQIVKSLLQVFIKNSAIATAWSPFVLSLLLETINALPKTVFALSRSQTRPVKLHPNNGKRFWPFPVFSILRDRQNSGARVANSVP